MTKKNSRGSKIPPPPHNFSNGPSLKLNSRFSHILSTVFLSKNMSLKLTIENTVDPLL